VTLAKASMTIDHLTGGRVEVALGVGDPTAGGATAGVTAGPAERVARFAEFVELVDLLLRQEVTTYQGDYFQCQGAETIPLPVQRPRPPITVAAHGPKMLRIAARFADSWSSFGGYEVVTEEDLYRVTAERSARFDDLAAALGRDPKQIRHSLVCFPPLTPWVSADYFEDMVGRLGDVGIDEFVLYWPGSWPDDRARHEVFQEITESVMPRLRSAD
jgi:alkanesulfonate monooxygenase SsuD/methylene tetrahydromethanopterin reductase-like flavin-dependent oxidoreductase (luciferase family)